LIKLALIWMNKCIRIVETLPDSQSSSVGELDSVMLVTAVDRD
jgi:hypothetical protein